MRAIAERRTVLPEFQGLSVTPSLLTDFPDIEQPAILEAVVEVVRAMQPRLMQVCAAVSDRHFVDAHLAANPKDEVIGKRDAAGRVVIGPLADDLMLPVVASFMEGQVLSLTPDSEDEYQCDELSSSEVAWRRSFG